MEGVNTNLRTNVKQFATISGSDSAGNYYRVALATYALGLMEHGYAGRGF